MIPHLAFPLEVGPTGSFNVVAQDSTAEVQQSVAVLCGTVRGDRLMVPDYGLDDPTFTSVDPAELVLAVAQWEPRAQVSVTVTPDGYGAAQTTVAVSLIAPSS